MDYQSYTALMIKDYIRLIHEWCRLKIELWSRRTNKVLFNDGEIWWCSLGMNVGEEIFGKGGKFTRPVLIFRKFTSNSFLGLPLTTQENHGTWYVLTNLHGTKRWALLNQARILDKKRLTSKIGALSETDFKFVKGEFIAFYSSENRHPALLERGSVGKPKL